MLVCFGKGFTMEGECTEKYRKHFWSKPIEVREKIYLNTGISGICDEADLEAEVERLTKERLNNSSGWGKDFSGWQRVVPYDEAISIAKNIGWSLDAVPTNFLRITYLDDWTMDKVLKTLTGKQFAQFCKDNKIVWKMDWKEND